jgi:hypothetical protein
MSLTHQCVAPSFSHQHLQQLDPTEIIAIPYNLARLVVYVAVVFGASIVAKGAFDFTRARLVAKYAGLLCVWCLVSGASPYTNRLHTLWASLYLSILLWFDPPIFVATTRSRLRHDLSLLDHMKERLLVIRRRDRQGANNNNDAVSSNPQALLASITTQSTMAGTIPAQILLLYDRGWQLQRWPVPLVLGSTIGWCIGLVIGTVVISHLSYRQQSSNKKRDDVGNNLG